MLFGSVADGVRSNGCCRRRIASLYRSRQEYRFIVKLNVYVVRSELIQAVQQELSRRFDGPYKPALSFVVTRLPQSGALVAADAVATTSVDPEKSVQLVTGKKHLAASQSTVSIIPNGTRIYISGQTERANSLSEATRLTLQGLRKTLRFLGRGDGDMPTPGFSSVPFRAIF